MKCKVRKFSALAMIGGFMTACSPDVGSKAWCDDLKKQPKGEWTANQAKDFAKHCVFK